MTTFSLPGTTTSDPDREFWRGVLLAGGSTAIPRWTLTPMAGVGQHAGAIPGGLAAALRRLADEMGVPLSSVLLAVHAKVLAALSGEREVVTSYVTRPGGQAGGRPAASRMARRASGRCPAGWRPGPAPGGNCCWTPAGPRPSCSRTSTTASVSCAASWA